MVLYIIIHYYTLSYDIIEKKAYTPIKKIQLTIFPFTFQSTLAYKIILNSSLIAFAEVLALCPLLDVCNE